MQGKNIHIKMLKGLLKNNPKYKNCQTPPKFSGLLSLHTPHFCKKSGLTKLNGLNGSIKCHCSEAPILQFIAQGLTAETAQSLIDFRAFIKVELCTQNVLCTQYHIIKFKPNLLSVFFKCLKKCCRM